MKLLTLKSIAVNTLPVLIPRGTLSTVAAVRTGRRGHTCLVKPEKTEGEESVREFAGLHARTCHFSVSGAS